MEHIKTFEAACKVLGIDPAILPNVDGLDESRAKAQIAIYKLDIISEASWKHAGKQLDWSNPNQYKYYPWFRMSGSGSGFSCDDFDYDLSLSFVGSRLVYPDSETAEFAGETHLEFYRDFMLR